MRLTRLALAFGFVMGVAVLGCGGGSGSKSPNPGEILASCGVPACYLDLFLSCMPDGACVEQNTAICGASACPTPATSRPTSVTTNVCFDNGVKLLIVQDMSNPPSVTMTNTAMKGSAVCYTTTGLYSTSGTTTTVTAKNAVGTTVATVVADATARTETITCVGDSPVVVSLDCLKSDGGTPGSGCTSGICEP